MTDIAAPLQVAALWGSDHEELGEIAVQRVGRRAAVALSRGKYPKAYPHVDKNEDAAAAATDGSSWVLAVADGHAGFDAARAAMGAVVDGMAATLEEDPELALRSTFEAARDAIAAAVHAIDEPRQSSRTALSVAMVTEGRISAAGRGDTVVVRIRDGRAALIGRPVEFLGPSTDLSGLAIDRSDFDPADHLVLATDGVYDFLGRGWDKLLASSVTVSDPEQVVRDVIGEAFAGGSGDNLGLVYLGPGPT